MNSLKSPHGYVHTNMVASLIDESPDALKQSCWSCMRLFFLVGLMSVSCRQSIFFQSYFLTVDAALSCYFGGVNGKPGSSSLLLSSHASSRFLPLPYERLLRRLKESCHALPCTLPKTVLQFQFYRLISVNRSLTGFPFLWYDLHKKTLLFFILKHPPSYYYHNNYNITTQLSHIEYEKLKKKVQGQLEQKN